MICYLGITILGRTGRRAGWRRNCLFLATSRDALLRAAALVRLWDAAYVEPIIPPPKPYHLFAQQVLALVLQQGGLGRRAWKGWVGSLSPFHELQADEAERILEHMLAIEMLAEDSGILGIGPAAERAYGAKNFLELVSIFDSPPLYVVFYGPHEIGSVHPISFQRRSPEPIVLSLAGRSWQVTHIDHTRKTANVLPSEEHGRSLWMGGNQPLSFDCCQAVRHVLLDQDADHRWSRRAVAEMRRAREECAFADQRGTVIDNLPGRDRTVWWTFAGILANTLLARQLEQVTRRMVRAENYAVVLGGALPFSHLESLLSGLPTVQPSISSRAEALRRDLKFCECLPEELLYDELNARGYDRRGAEQVLAMPRIYRQNTVPSAL
ncbi:MAG: hypothetical protein AAB403_18705 [Planctomycetota bacterium]